MNLDAIQQQASHYSGAQKVAMAKRYVIRSQADEKLVLYRLLTFITANSIAFGVNGNTGLTIFLLVGYLWILRHLKLLKIEQELNAVSQSTHSDRLVNAFECGLWVDNIINNVYIPSEFNWLFTEISRKKIDEHGNLEIADSLGEYNHEHDFDKIVPGWMFFAMNDKFLTHSRNQLGVPQMVYELMNLPVISNGEGDENILRVSNILGGPTFTDTGAGNDRRITGILNHNDCHNY